MVTDDKRNRRVRFVSDSQTLAKMCRTILSVTDVTRVDLFPDCSFYLRSDDLSNSYAVEVRCESTVFSDCESNFHDVLRIALNWSEFNDAIRCYKEGERVCVEITETDLEGVCVVNVSGKDVVSEFTTENPDTGRRLRVSPNSIHGKVVFELEAQPLYEFCKRQTHGHTVTLWFDEGVFRATILKRRNNIWHEYRRKVDTISGDGETANSKFSVSFLCDTLKCLDGVVTVELGDDCPVKFTLKKDGVGYMYLIAQRVPEDGEGWNA